MRTVVVEVLGDASRAVAAGLAVGLLAALWLSRLMAPLVFGVPVTDAATFLLAPAALALVAAVAGAVPALRSARVSPVDALRADRRADATTPRTRVEGQLQGLKKD